MTGKYRDHDLRTAVLDATPQWGAIEYGDYLTVTCGAWRIVATVAGTYAGHVRVVDSRRSTPITTRWDDVDPTTLRQRLADLGAPHIAVEVSP